MSEKNNIACPKCNYVQGHTTPTVAYWDEKCIWVGGRML